MRNDDLRKQLIRKIRDFRKKTRIAKSTFGVQIINDGNLIADLEAGRDISISTYQKISDFINSYNRKD